MNISPAAVERALTARTKAVIAVHLYGHPADMDSLRSICAGRGVRLVEDAAEAHGATIAGRPAGSLGDIATFSFFGNKIMTTGEGGMVTTDSAELDGIVRLLKGQGQDPQRRYWFPVVGYNYRMTNVAAAVGLAQLEQLPQHLADRRRVGDAYDERLADVSGVRRPVTRPGCENVRWLYTVVLEDHVAVGRDELAAALAAAGIETRPVFYPMHQMPPFRNLDAEMPVADHLAARGISLPTHGHLDEADIDRITSTLADLIA